MNGPTRLRPLFHCGNLFVTSTALVALRSNGIPLISIVLRHIAGDWGDVSVDDWQQNDLSVASNLRLLSIYVLPDGTKLWVVTEWNRSSTNIRLANDLPLSSAARRSQTVIRKWHPTGDA
jgi:hypothetical protein